MGASQRRKGAAGEREFINEVLKPAGYHTAARQLDQSRDGGGDIVVGGVLWEVKRRAGIAPLRFLEQAEAAERALDTGDLMAVVAMREDGDTRWTVMLRADDFMRLLAQSKPMGHNLPNTVLDTPAKAG